MKKFTDYAPEEKKICIDRGNSRDFADIIRLKKLFRNKKFKKQLIKILIVYDVDSKEWLLRNVISYTEEPAMYYFFRKEIRQALQGINNPCKEVFLKHFR